MVSKYLRSTVLVIFMVIGSFVFSGIASADNSSCSTATDGNVTCVQQALGQEGTATDSTSVSVRAVSKGKAKVTLLVAEHFVSSAQMKEAKKNGECHWYKEIWNSGFLNGKGKLGWKLDHHVYGCWVDGKLYKYGGGETGEACGNLLRLVSEPPPKTAVHAKAEFVAFMRWIAIAHVTATAPATAKAVVSVHNADNSCQSSASGTGTATGTATATAKATAKSKAAAQASAEGEAVKLEGGLNQEASVKASAEAKASATAQASAKATCTPTTTTTPPPPAVCTDKSATNYGGSLPCQYPPPPPPVCTDHSATNYNGPLPCEYPPPPPVCTDHGATNYGGPLPCEYPPPEEKKYTEVSCTGFEEITGGGSFLVDCDVNTNTGKPISLTAHSNDSNSRVSGINCYSNGGSQTCPSTGGTFEFRVSGINSSSSIKYSSITAVASAGGVESKPFTSDPYPVDPEEGGFKN